MIAFASFVYLCLTGVALWIELNPRIDNGQIARVVLASIAMFGVARVGKDVTGPEVLMAICILAALVIAAFANSANQGRDLQGRYRESGLRVKPRPPRSRLARH